MKKSIPSHHLQMPTKTVFNRAASILSHISSAGRSSLPSSRSTQRCATTMATAATLSLSSSTPGVLNVPKISPESYAKANELLQKNHDDFHMYFNQSGFHNHIAHHLLTILALGASPSQIQTAYDNNAHYQRPQFPVNQDTVAAMSDPAIFAKHLNNEKYFHDYEIYFRKEIEKLDGDWQAMLNEQLFGTSAQAQDLLVRTFAGFYHPIIHLGFGIEFNQPAIIVEALAQSATHDNWPKSFIDQTSALAKDHIQNNKKSRSLFSILHEARENSKIRSSAHSEDGNKVRDGVFKRGVPDITELCSQWHVEPTEADIRLKTAEMINMCAYFAGAAQHSSHQKQIKFDFFYMHCINASIFFSAFLRPEVSSWLSKETHAKLLMVKGWNDVAMYVSRGTPELFIDEIRNYKAKKPSDGWDDIFARVDALGHDDGHAPKLVRALANGEKACREFEDGEGRDWMIKGDDWLKLGHMAIDSVEGPGPTWVRNAGFEEAWSSIEQRKRDEGFPGSSNQPMYGGERYHE